MSEEKNNDQAQVKEPENGANTHDDTVLQSNNAEEEVTAEENSNQELSQLKEKYLRLVAEFENYKKRTAKERFGLIQTAGEDLVKDLLPVMDDFERAKNNTVLENGEKGLPEGIELIYQKFSKVLEKKGVQPIELDNVFDPEVHEAITEIPAPTDELKGKIVDTIEKGYKMNDKIIRHPKVVIGK